MEEVVEKTGEKHEKESQNNYVAYKPSNGYFKSMTTGGYIFLCLATLPLVSINIKYLLHKNTSAEKGEDKELYLFLLQSYAFEIILITSSVILGFFALKLLYGANRSRSAVIPTEDRQLLEPLIARGEEKSINQYVVLSSLTGFTGTFQKIGFSGLPLATVTLTLFFSALSFLDNQFIELAKLTLGAFIGSFVQKGADELTKANNKQAIEVQNNDQSTTNISELKQ